MTAATTRKSKPNESRSFPDPSAMRDAVATPYHTHLLPHKLYNNPTSSSGFHSAYDDSSFLISSDLSLITYHLMPVLPTPSCCPSSMGCPFICHHMEKLVLFGSDHDPVDNVKEII